MEESALEYSKISVSNLRLPGRHSRQDKKRRESSESPPLYIMIEMLYNISGSRKTSRYICVTALAHLMQTCCG